ncbi:MAG: ceramidase [Gammaproteobacteria bacterium]|nr:ceramidase [Gammaproteobacteria bacterium]
MNRAVIWVLSALGLVLLFMYTSPTPQDPAYYLFADNLTKLSLPNFWNVASNIPYAFIGIWGFLVVSNASRMRPFVLQGAYKVFFLGVFLTAFGSSYFHFNPGHDTLFWDRLPMTISFAGLFSVVIGETNSPQAGRRWLPLFLVVGLASVVYWQWTEARGVGDLRPYAIVQFLPIILVPVMLLTGKRENTVTATIWFMIGTYIVAKFFEHFDTEIFALPGMLSGHTLKHFVSALGPAALAYTLGKDTRTATAVQA